MVLAFRACEESDDLEPVFLRIFRANGESDREAALIAITDENGLSLGRYVVGRRQLDDALGRAEEVTQEETEPAGVPLEWGAA